MARLNKKILCFVDEYGTAGEPGFALGCVMVWARDCGRADKAFSDILPASVNEVRASKWAGNELQGLLSRFAQTEAGSRLSMLNKLGDGNMGTRPEIYSVALIEIVKIGIKRFRETNNLGNKIGNVEVIVDANEQNTHPKFHDTISAARFSDGIFRAVVRVNPIDSTVSRMLQLADVVAHSRAWINKGEENAEGLRTKYKIAVL